MYTGYFILDSNCTKLVFAKKNVRTNKCWLITKKFTKMTIVVWIIIETIGNETAWWILIKYKLGQRYNTVQNIDNKSSLKEWKTNGMTEKMFETHNKETCCVFRFDEGSCKYSIH